ncbi:hypothetical protein ZYGR_0H05160 [Zygosaccharomyces rouxii]|uniref:ZYRO0B15906p n=2 Tax=Zygosaccharomyces rouxii TaxID=4956 RepID=C5DSD2_ZYGRC|nr:uncharacterized protein ZYRO0B15906g [Zygosaccharomyces rouxii]KAH9199776.1 SGS domain-containing protein [Zygosaccharomyces rouxii]GAV47670.1 hypothetical protein ZYGR_0H05160 [Zygosaccharomyces rouxii]CAR26693.1 ZYRO0B15906p [Zygosaccharomyces rouxii]
MPVETDLKDAYQLLYDKHEPLKALQRYDGILKQYPENLVATIYKAAALEKLYFGSSDWHNGQTLENSRDLLGNALILAQKRGDRSKIALVYFRHFIHNFNSKKYAEAQTYMAKCKEYGYQDDTLPMWEYQLQRKLDKLAQKGVKVEPAKTITTPVEEPKDSKQTTEKENTSTSFATASTPKFRTDWYQTSNTVVLSIFTANLPKNKECVTLQVSKKNKRDLEMTYPIPDASSEFQYNLSLSHEVDPENIQLNIFTKKMEITLAKLTKVNWRTLEYTNESENVSTFQQPKIGSKGTSPSGSLGYPTSSKKSIDWSKVDLSDDEDENSGTPDAFFQKLYADADPDTKRAMMKSYMESNGTALNTNWEDVSQAPVETSPPEGMELKHW